MTAILAEFAPYVALAAQPDYTLMNIFAVAIIGVTGVACAIALRKKDGKTA